LLPPRRGILDRAVEHTTLKICFICDEYPRPGCEHGGIGTFTQIMGRELAQRGHAVRVIGIGRNDAAPREEWDQGVKVVRLRSTRIPHIGWIHNRYRLYRQVASWARRGEVDLLEVPDYEGWSAAWGRLPIPVIMRLNGSATYFADEMGKRISRLAFGIERQAIRRADYYCSASRYTADRTRQLFGLNGMQIAVVYNPMSVPDRCSPWQPAGDRAVYTGTLVAKKGVVPLVLAWKLLLRAVPDAELHLYGKDGRSADGSSMREYLGAQLSEEERRTVFFHGHVSRQEIQNALRSARAAAFPSFSEAFGLAPLEAMAQGCPTIYTRRASGPELIRDGQDGLLVDPANPDEIADALIRLFRDHDFAARIAGAGWQRVKQSFSTELIVAENVAYYEECLARFAGSVSCKRAESSSAANHATASW